MIHSPFDPGSFDFKWDTIASPVAGADLSIVTPVNARSELVALSFLYTCDANVANRFIRVYAVHGGRAIVIGGAELALTANQVRHILVGPFGFSSVADGGDTIVIGTVPFPLFLEGGLLRTWVQNIQATDTITVVEFAFKTWTFEQ